jgi:glycosyltransferase involved in cell wall biosynthesis
VRTFLLVHHAPAPGRLALRLYAGVLSRLVVWGRIPLITVSRASQAALEQGTPLKPFTPIYNGIEPAPGAEDFLDLRSRYGIPAGLVLVGIIGPLDPHKGHEVLFRAFGQSPLLRQQAGLLIVGKGEPQYESALRRLVKADGFADRAIFTGFLPESSTSIIREFDILAMPSTTFEGFGYSMAEAMALGVPVVASRVGAIPEIVQDGETGLLVDPNDPAQLRRALERLVLEPALRHSLGINGQKRILGRFSAQQMAEEYYRFLMGSPSD